MEKIEKYRASGLKPEMPPKYVAYWHSHGGREHAVILPPGVQPPECWRLDMVYKEESYEFFLEEMKKFSEFDYCIENNQIRVSCPPYRIGWWIGKKGWKIKTIQSYFNKRITIEEGIEISTDYDEDRGQVLIADGHGEITREDEEHVYAPHYSSHTWGDLEGGYIASFRLKKEVKNEH
jgi:hypothetical protein